MTARLAQKAFWPQDIPFPFMHVDTGHNFEETIEFRDQLVRRMGVKLIVAAVEESIKRGRVVEETGPRSSRNPLQSTTLMDAIEEHRFDCCFGGARRDEEKARAKERFFPIGMNLESGTPKSNVLNCGISSIREKTLVSTFESFPSTIGRNWMFGPIFKSTISPYPPSILPTKERFFSEMVSSTPRPPLWS